MSGVVPAAGWPAAGLRWIGSPRPRGPAVSTVAALGLVALASALAETVLIALSGQAGASGWTLAMASLFLAGVVCAWRRPDELAARRLLLAGTTAIVWIAGGLGLAIAHRQLGSGQWLVAPNTVMVGLDLLLPASVVALAAAYPSGEAQSGWESTLVRAALASAVLVPVLLLLSRPALHPMLAFRWEKAYSGPVGAVASPLSVGWLEFLGGGASFWATNGFGVEIAVAAALLLARYRRVDGELRMRTRWPLVAIALAALQPLGDALVSWGILPEAAVDAPVILMIIVLAVALAVGLLKPALFDLGRVVRRTAAYVALWTAIGVVCIAIAGAAGVAASSQGLKVAVAVAIAVTLLAGRPRRALARRAARWAYGERLNGPEMLRRVGESLEHTLEPQALARTLAAAIREGLGVSWVRLEIEDGPSALSGERPSQHDGGQEGTRVALAYGSKQLGLLELAPAVPPVDPVVLGNIARQAALAMGNARLAAEARARAEQLAASRTRIVEAQETARRRLERDIHDGVQQELVAVIAKIGITRAELPADPGTLDGRLADLQSEVALALAHLRELAGGIHPSVLGDRGIVEAIRERASRLPIPVAVECPQPLRARRFAEPVEGAVYFVVCEALANALKHAAPARIVVRVSCREGLLAVEICDDGCGFDPLDATGSGLSGLADRVDALGGRFIVSSVPGAGTVLRASFPIVERRREQGQEPRRERPQEPPLIEDGGHARWLGHALR